MQIPEKHFYTIGDISQMMSIKPHILRYWEQNFKALKPQRRYSGHRKYTRREIDLIQRIRYLVIDRKFTLHGAAKEINRQAPAGPNQLQLKEKSTRAVPTASLPLIRDIKKDVEDCLSLLRPKAQQIELAGLK